MLRIVKKNGTHEDFEPSKIIKAIKKSASRVGITLSKNDCNNVVAHVRSLIEDDEIVGVIEIHGLVERALDFINPHVSKSYKDYRNYKNEFHMGIVNNIESQVYKVLSEVDRENSNSNTRYISTKRTEVAQIFAKEMFQKMFLSTRVLEAIKDGYIYIHDLKDMLLPQFNCCLTDVKSILSGGFELENVWYNEPKDIRTAVGQVGDIIMVISSQHYGGNTTPQIDKILSKYYKMTIDKYYRKYRDLSIPKSKAKKISRIEAYNDLKQSLQGLEVMLNTVVSARGSYPFTTFSFGDVGNEYEADVCKALLEVRMEGHGKKDKKKRMIFPKLVFLHNKEIHGDNCEFGWLFDKAVACSSVSMYPDYIGETHKREGKWVSPMGCRAYLSNYRDPDTGELVFDGRFNIGAVSLNLPMIFMKSKVENRPFLEVLDYYLQMIRELHIQRYEYLGKAQANSNPLMFTQGGAYGGYLNPEDRIAPLLKSATASFGITALNELSVLATNKTIAEDNTFVVDTMKYINDKVNQFKKEDGWLYALYGTPAESLCGTQVQQFRKVYGIIKNVSDREYFTNSFHCHVSEELSPFEKQNKEHELFHMTAGGHIQYVRVNNPDNHIGLKKLITRGLEMGFYQGVNFNACYCEDCGHSGSEFGHTCPNCGSKNVDEINRTCGYLGYSRKRGDRTFNDYKMAEIRDRKSM